MKPFALASLLTALVIPLQAAAISRQSAEEFSQKMALIQRQGDAATAQSVGSRRTRLTEDELNSWFMYRAPDRRRLTWMRWPSGGRRGAAPSIP
jgi:hypothetical protein